jgi:hypothetical protein
MGLAIRRITKEEYEELGRDIGISQSLPLI